MSRKHWLTTTVAQLLPSVVFLALVAVIALVVPASAASINGNNGGKDIVSTTENYLTTFYPIWFTHTQFAVAPHNELIGPDTISPVYQGVVAINDDTLYASSPIDVSGGPVSVSVPGSTRERPDRFKDLSYSVLLLDPYGNVYPSGIPSKTAGVNTPTTVYALVGPDDPESVLNDITVRLPLKFMVLIFRVDKFSNGVNEITEATDFRAALSVNGVPTNVRPVIDFAFPVKTIADTLIRTDPILFLRQTQAAVADTSSTPSLTRQEQKLSDDFDTLFGDGMSLTPEERSMFAAGARSAHDAILSNYLNNLDANNWIHFTNIGQWKKEVLDRASITEFCQFCNTIKTAAYYHAFLDGNGAPLEGSNPDGYVMTFPPGGTPDASRFWSLTAYTPDAIELIPNASDKYVVASYTPGLVTNPDGSISIYISEEQPDGVPVANWLPVSDRAFNVMLRVYGVVPKSDVAKNKYVPPPIEKW